MSTTLLPSRDQVNEEDTWDLGSLFPDDAAWETAFAEFQELVPRYQDFVGKLGTSASVIAELLAFDGSMDRRAERLGVYAMLKTTEDQTNSDYQGMKGKFQHAAMEASQLQSYPA